MLWNKCLPTSNNLASSAVFSKAASHGSSISTWHYTKWLDDSWLVHPLVTPHSAFSPPTQAYCSSLSLSTCSSIMSTVQQTGFNQHIYITGTFHVDNVTCSLMSLPYSNQKKPTKKESQTTTTMSPLVKWLPIQLQCLCPVGCTREWRGERECCSWKSAGKREGAQTARSAVATV